ncbi:unnamed protein product [Rhizoctonia solani]|uniref:Uncharacterized protein n=1 Tax=Rhizoctonia solani TaxID=456999 RepID=A0A8H3D8U1_9AGAM|nr:unnamed protein product [Rhizoctonia solani]
MDWRSSKNKDTDVVISNTNKTCPVCRAPSKFITPSSRFSPKDSPERERCVKGYKATLGKIPCRLVTYFVSRIPKLILSGMSYHQNDDGTPYTFSLGADEMMERHKSKLIASRALGSTALFDLIAHHWYEGPHFDHYDSDDDYDFHGSDTSELVEWMPYHIYVPRHHRIHLEISRAKREVDSHLDTIHKVGALVNRSPASARMDPERERPLSNAIDWILPPLIISYAIWGLYMSVFHVGFGWVGCHEASPIHAAAHVIFSLAAVLLIIGLILFLWTLPLDHDVPPRTDHTVAQEWYDQYPRECFNKEGTLLVGSCLTVHQSKAFFTLLVTTAFSTCVMAMPVARPILDGAYTMYLVSRSHPACNRLWWDWWGSYVVFGGPGGRWVLGTVLGYWVAKPQAPVNPHMCQYGLPFMRPTMSGALTLTIALSLAGFCLVLAARMAFHLLKGQTTIEALQSGTLRGRDTAPQRFLWLPSSYAQAEDSFHRGAPVVISAPAEGIRHRTPLSSDSLRTRGSTVPLDPDVRIYDLGIWQNVKVNWSRPMFSARSRPETLSKPPRINPDIIKRISETGT